METTTLQSRPSSIDAWQKAEPSRLHNCFDCFIPGPGSPGPTQTNNQYVRLSLFQLSSEHLEEIKGIHPISSMCIWMGLKPIEDGKQQFQPVLEVLNIKKEPAYYPLQAVEAISPPSLPDPTNGDRGLTERVPSSFANHVSKLWLDSRPENMPSLFSCRTAQGLLRVHCYLITGTGLSFIAENLMHTSAFKLYLGIDRNKASEQYPIYFTPVIGLSFDSVEKIETKSILTNSGGIRWDFSKPDDDGGEVFLEYSRPCPPTCDD